MPLQDHMALISVDDHVIEHGRVWEDRLPAEYREAGPRFITADHVMRGPHVMGDLIVQPGDQVWQFEGEVHPQFALNAVAGKDPKEWNGKEPTKFSEILPGCYDPKARVADMDADGIQAMLLFPTFPRFA